MMHDHDRRSSVQSSNSDTTTFPAFDENIGIREHETIYEDPKFNWSNGRRPSASPARRPNGLMHSEKWAPRKDFRGNGAPVGRTRQKSLSEAIRTINERRGSIGANAHEIAEALKAPISFKLVVWCIQH